MNELNELEPCPYCWVYKGEITTPEINQVGGYWWAICPSCLYSISRDARNKVIQRWNENAHAFPKKRPRKGGEE